MSTKPQTSQRLSAQLGLTIVELMIAVAIVGVLGTIGGSVVIRMARKARQAEVKTQLAAVYTAQKTFYSRWQQYYGDFRDIGYTPEGDLNYRVRIGQGVGLPGDYDFLGGACTIPEGCANVVPVQFATSLYCPANNRCREIPGRVAGIINVIAPSQAGFLTGAASNLDGDADTDEWTIDQDKNLVHRSNDL